jgi:uroporphyrinogen-III synthase
MGNIDSANLSGMNILVTRPQEQQQELVNLIKAADGQAICFPTLEIAPTEKQDALTAQLSNLDRFDMAVFVSPNAARFVFDALQAESLALPPSLLLACVGKGCSKAVLERGYTVHAIPVDGIGSEGLLKHELMQVVEGKRIIIFRGNGGRELLEQTLAERGAQVEYSECYQRRAPRRDASGLIRDWQQKGIHMITITSTQALRNLWSMLGDDAGTLITSTPMVVISKRIAETAIDMGCSRDNVLVASDTSDAAIVTAIKKWRMHQKAI